MKRKTNEKLNDEIKQLNLLIRKSKNGDKRNEIRLEKIKTLKQIVNLNNKLKSKQVSAKNYSIQYKDLSKQLKYARKIRTKPARTNNSKITSEDIMVDRALNYAGIFDWKNSLTRGIISALARGGLLDDLLGFDFSQYIGDGGAVDTENYLSAIDYLKTYKAEEFYDLLDKYFHGINYESMAAILKKRKYKTQMDELWYEEETDTPFFEIERFEKQLKKIVKKVRKDYEKL